jgi:catechol 2,3-dioxygenase
MPSPDYFDYNAAPIQIGMVTLKVRDLPQASAFYQEVLGLETLSTGPRHAILGVNGEALLKLSGDHGLAPLDRRQAGLYHIAFVLPSRRDLARWLVHAIDKRVPLQGASDHYTHEAIYLADPEGNGIEVYADRPTEHWQAPDGTILTTSTALDIDNLLAAAGPAVWKGLPSGGLIGHIHLQVDQTSDAEHFFGKIIGLEVSIRMQGAIFFAGGGYHHQIACNNWGRPSLAAHRQNMAGLESFELIVRRNLELPRVAERAETAVIPAAWHDCALALRDPWGTTIILKS